MSFANLKGTVTGLTIRYNQLQSIQGHLSSRLMALLRQSTDFTKDYNDAKNALRNTYAVDSTEYKVELEKIEEEHDFKMASFDMLNNEIDMESQSTQNEAMLVKEQRDDYISMLKTNIKNDMNYISGSSSS